MTQNKSLLHMARNALLEAGHEIGEDGEHWRLIKDTMGGLARAYEALKIEEEVSDQLRVHMKDALDNYETLLESFATELEPDVLAELRRFVTELREIYTARFDDLQGELDPLADLRALAHDIDGMLSPEDASIVLNQKLEAANGEG